MHKKTEQDERKFSLQELIAEHERVLSKTGAYTNSDVQKTLAHLKDAIKGVVDEIS